MRVHVQYLPELVCDPEATRFALAHPYLDLSDPDNPVLVGTNGRTLIAVPVSETTEDQSGSVHTEAIKLAREPERTWRQHIALKVSATETAIPEFCSFKAPQGKFPNWRECGVEEGREEVSISLDVELLYNLVKAAGGVPGYVTLHFAKGAKGIDTRRVMRVEVTGSAAMCLMMLQSGRD